jgi:hypothetical protein
MGLHVPEGHLMLGALSTGESGEHKGDGAEGEEGLDDDDVDEVTGYHFVDCTTLFVSYVYVNSAAKVFEDRVSRAAPSETPTEFPDFEAIYHLVIDAVDTYNDRWETVFKQQQEVQLCDDKFVVSNNLSSLSASSGTGGDRQCAQTVSGDCEQQEGSRPRCGKRADQSVESTRVVQRAGCRGSGQH